MDDRSLDDGSKISSLEKTIRFLETELEREIVKKRAGLRYGMEKGKAIFEQEVLRRHKELKRSLWESYRKTRFIVLLVSPIIYFGIVPIVIMDLFVTVYQHTCFRAYGIALVKRSDYMIFERTHLAYLNIIQMVNCAYCSYGNGVIAYTREIFARTERYWCPIKHAKKVVGYHDKYDEFADFGDAEAFVKKYMQEHNERKISSKIKVKK